jgi:hypothetical protein
MIKGRIINCKVLSVTELPTLFGTWVLILNYFQSKSVISDHLLPFSITAQYYGIDNLILTQELWY